MRFSLLAALLLLPPSLAQNGAGHVVVISRTSGPAITSLFDVDLTTGVSQPIGRFALDTFPPLAVAVDGINRDLVVALLNPAGSSTLVRLRLAGTQVVQQTTLGDVPGVVTAMAQAMGGSWVTTSTPGVLATERNGSVARLIAPLSLATAIDAFGTHSYQAVVAQSGSATSDPQVRWIDLQTGQTLAGPWVYAGHMPRGMTGVGDLPTGLPRQVVSQDDGTIAMSVSFANPVPLPLTPALPPGATTAMRMLGSEGIVLGGMAHPFVKSFQVFGGTQWTLRSGPLAGDPVDFAFRPTPVAATVLVFGSSCGEMTLREGAFGPPRIGNTAYTLHTTGLPSSMVLLLLGASDQHFGGLRLPFALPGGCLVRASGEIILLGATSGAGVAQFMVGVPNSPALVDAIVFAQSLQTAGRAIDTSNAAAIWIGR